MRTLRTIAVISLGAVLLVGCGKSSSSDEPMNARSFAAGFADTVCSALATCSCTDPSAVEDCKTAYNEMISQELSWMLTGSSSWKVDPAAAKTCLADMKAMLGTCTAPPPNADGFPESCRESLLIVGTQAVDDRCNQDSDCAPGLACDWSTYTCATRVAVDGDCSNVACADGLFCAPGAVCTARPGVGEACPFGNCLDGLTCRYDSTADGNLCFAPHALSEGCSDGYACAVGTYCDRDDTVTCLALKADGETCTSWDQCLHAWCNGFDNTCADPGICWLMEPK